MILINAMRIILDLNSLLIDFFMRSAYLVIRLFLVLYLFNRLILNQSWITEFIGTCALLIESLLPLPQFFSNYRAKSVIGIRSFSNIICHMQLLSFLS
jgi:hypothetical protein